MNILVVEDNDGLRQGLVSALTAKDHHVVEARDGQEAIEKLATEEGLDVILLDLDLGPGVDGWEVARRKLSDPRTAHIPLVITTGFSAEAVHARDQQPATSPLAGALLILNKPVDLDRLDNILAFIERHKTGRRAAST